MWLTLWRQSYNQAGQLNGSSGSVMGIWAQEVPCVYNISCLYCRCLLSLCLFWCCWYHILLFIPSGDSQQISRRDGVTILRTLASKEKAVISISVWLITVIQPTTRLFSIMYILQCHENLMEASLVCSMCLCDMISSEFYACKLSACIYNSNKFFIGTLFLFLVLRLNSCL